MSAIQRTTIGGVEVDCVRPLTKDSSTPRLLFIHGACGNSGFFEKWLEYCAANGIEAYAPNLKPGDDVSIYDYARRVSGVVDQIGPTVILGHSMGGLIAQIVASENHNQKVLAAVFIASAAPKGTKGRISKAPWFWLRPTYGKAVATGKLFRIRKANAMRCILNNTPDPERIYASFGPESGMVLREMTLGVKVGAIECPTLVIGGDHDLLLGNGLQQSIAKKYGSNFLPVPTGHMVQLEDTGNRVLRQVIYWAKYEA